MRYLLYLLTSLIIIFSCSSQQAITKQPLSDRIIVIDTLNTSDGNIIYEDPYRWLEDDSSKKTLDWVNAQNTYFKEYMDRESDEWNDSYNFFLNNIPDTTYQLPARRCDKIYTQYIQLRGENQPCLYMMDSPKGKRTKLLDPNLLGKNASINWTKFNKSGSYMAYSVSYKGSDDEVLKIMDMETQEILGDSIPGIYMTLDWDSETSFYYLNNNPEPTSWRAIFHHKLGDKPDQDEKVYVPEEKNQWIGFGLTDDLEYQILFHWYGWVDGYQIFIRNNLTAGKWEKFLDKGHNVLICNDSLDKELFYLTTKTDAPRGRLVKASLSDFTLRDVIPESETLNMESAFFLRNKFIVTYTLDGYNLIKVFTKEGKYLYDISLPTKGTITDMSAYENDPTIYIGFKSFTYPFTIIRHHVDLNSTHHVYQRKIDGLNPSDYEVKIFETPSRDGFPVRGFIVHHKDLEFNSSNPVYIYAYGGFNNIQKPYFSNFNLDFIRQGGIFVMPHLRGDGTYGQDFHNAGTRENKKRTYDDLIATIEYLLNKRYTNPEKISAYGGSNGGLLMSSLITLRPNLIKAAIIGAPITDMTRYHLYTDIAKGWANEYGIASDSSQAGYLYEYSPYHHVSRVKYPNVLISIDLTDNRTGPAHGWKFGAMLQNYNTSEDVILIRTETGTGHNTLGREKGMIWYADFKEFLRKTIMK